MSETIRDILIDGCHLNEEQGAILVKNIRKLSRAERKKMFQEINPRIKELKLYLEALYQANDAQKRKHWVDVTVESMLSRGGDPDIVDGMVMDIIGRLIVYKQMREQAEERGIRLTSLVNFGGLSMVLFLVVAIAAVIAYFLYR